jgi:hypothetical protein
MDWRAHVWVMGLLPGGAEGALEPAGGHFVLRPPAPSQLVLDRGQARAVPAFRDQRERPLARHSVHPLVGTL